MAISRPKPNKPMVVAVQPSTPVIFELTGPYAGQTVRLAGFDFVNGELHVPAANVAEVERRIAEYARRKRSRKSK